MNLLNKALELCAEIEQRQAELRAILSQLSETAKIEVESREATCCVQQTPVLSDQSDSSDKSDKPDALDQPEKPATPDLRKAFTINDRFRFRRELFGGDDKAFVEAIDRMSQCSDYNEIESFISTLGWSVDNEDVIAFKEVISTFYNGYHL